MYNHLIVIHLKKFIESVPKELEANRVGGHFDWCTDEGTKNSNSLNEKKNRRTNIFGIFTSINKFAGYISKVIFPMSGYFKVFLYKNVSKARKLFKDNELYLVFGSYSM